MATENYVYKKEVDMKKNAIVDKTAETQEQMFLLKVN